MKTDERKQVLYRYLLGDLPDAEQAALGEEIFADDETFEQVWAAENELVDQYVRGRLAPAEKELFESHYLASPVHRERVAFARTLLRETDAARGKATYESATTVPWWQSFLLTLSGNPRRWIAIAALLALVAGGAWLAIERTRLRTQLEQLEKARAEEQKRAEELEKEIAGERERGDQLAEEIERLSERRSLLPVPGQSSPDTKLDAGEPSSILSFLLSPTLMRGGSEPTRLSIPRETTGVVLQMKVEAPATQRFQVLLRTVEGKQIWSHSGITARPQGNNSALVSARIAASKLPAGDYILTLSAGAEPVEINRYFFSVIKP